MTFEEWYEKSKWSTNGEWYIMKDAWNAAIEEFMKLGKVYADAAPDQFKFSIWALMDEMEALKAK